MEATKMTPEVRAKLAGLLPMSAESVYEYTPEFFDNIPEEFKPVFSIKQFSNSQVTKIKEMMLNDQSSSSTKRKGKAAVEKAAKDNGVYMKILFSVFDGWSNLYDLGTGDIVEYDGTFECMLKLPEFLRTTIFTEAMKITGFLPSGVL